MIHLLSFWGNTRMNTAMVLQNRSVVALSIRDDRIQAAAYGSRAW
jgi:hypothetical protein